ncbi:MAG: exodeoxyribonuclease VII small subunit, partial [Rhizobium sp.]|nr:exodeoxyribonuclease VII small subunit [Rhizobium sp.]
MTENAVSAEISSYSFEKAVAELESIVARLQRGDVALDESISIYDRGQQQNKHSETLINAAESRNEKKR